MKKICSAAVCAAMAVFLSLPLTAATVGKVATNNTSLNVRSGAGTGYSIVSSAPKNSYLTVESEKDGWLKVRYGANNYGWVSDDYITSVPSKSRYVTTSYGKLNVRSGAGKGYSIVTRLSRGTEVLVISESGNWSKIVYNGNKVGWVSSEFLTSAGSTGSGSASDNTTTPVSGAVHLSIPRYSQTDSRWKYDYLGYSSKTIGSSGCTTTCIAMAETHLRGYTVYPDAMENELSYSSGGDLYWPNGYNAVFSKDFSLILSELRAGRPVLVGSKTYSGGQHWVLVTGYNGGGLKASSFIINDPGASARTNLSQFFSAFPVFYKLVTVRS